MSSNYVTFDEALTEARKRARETNTPHYAVEWPLGARTVDNRKPLIRDARTKVIEVMPSGQERYA